MLAAEYDNALDILQKIGIQAARLGMSQTGTSQDAETAVPQQPASRNFADILDENDRNAPRIEFAAAQAAKMAHPGEMHEARQAGPEQAGAPANRMHGRISEDWNPGDGVDFGKSAEGNGHRQRGSRATSVRAIDMGGSRMRISPIRRDGPARKTEKSAQKDGPEAVRREEERLVKCPGCGAEVSERSVVCVSCGEFLKR